MFAYIMKIVSAIVVAVLSILAIIYFPYQLQNNLDKDTRFKTPAYIDTFNPKNPTTHGAQWDVSSDGNGNKCAFGLKDNYHVVQTFHLLDPFDLHACHEDSYAYVNADIKVDVTILKGDSGGLFFHFNKDPFGNYTGYLFEIDHEGHYKFSIFTPIFTGKKLLNLLVQLAKLSLSDPSDPVSLLEDLNILSNILRESNPLTVLRDWTFSSALHPGYGVTNTLAVIINGNTFELYANDTSIITLTDSSNTHNYGDVGFFASAPDANTGVAFSNLKVWQQS